MPQLSFQLYSARNTDLADALKIIAEAGYTSVEAYSENFKNPDLFKAALEANALSVVSAHIGLDELTNNMDESLALANSFGIDHIVCPFLMPEARPTDKQGWVSLATQLAGINEVLEQNGKTFAWHNHDFEFDVLSDGSVPMQVLLEQAPKMHWELDIGWIQRAGANPATWLQLHADRISAIHLKDLAAEGECLDEDGWADVGHGVVDWQSLIADIKKTKASVFAVEHDNPSSLQRLAKNSFDSIQGWNWS